MKISIDELKCVCYSEENPDGSVYRRTIPPGADYSAEPVEVREVCAALHTPAVISAYASAVSMVR